MFNTPLNVVAAPPKAKAKPVEQARPVVTGKDMNITYNRDDRTDIDTAGYKNYLFQFKQTGEVGDKEMSELLISASSMNEAIETFERIFLRGDYYKDAVISVERIGVDFVVGRADKIVMCY